MLRMACGTSVNVNDLLMRYVLFSVIGRNSFKLALRVHGGMQLLANGEIPDFGVSTAIMLSSGNFP